MKQKWLGVLLHFSGLISRRKNTLANSQGFQILLIGFEILILEAINFLISLPAYFFVAPQALSTEKGKGIDKEAVGNYRLRRMVSLSVLAGIVGVWLLKLGITSLVVVGLFSGGHGAKAADTVSWDFNNPVAYLYDSSKIQITDGMAIFKANASPTIQVSATADISLPPTTGSVEASAASPVTSPSVSVTTQETTPTTASTTSPSVPALIDSSTPPPLETNPLPPVSIQAEAQVTTPIPTPTAAPEATPAPTPTPTVIEPSPTPAPQPTPVAPITPTPTTSGGSGLLLNIFPSLLPSQAHAQLSPVTTCQASIQALVPLAPLNLQAWSSFSETANLNGGSILYQLSADAGLTWQFWNGTGWVPALTPNDYNDSATISSHVASFPITTKTVLFRALLTSDCTHDVQLLAISITYDHIVLAEPAAQNTSYTLKAPQGITFTDEQGNAISATTKGAYITIGTKRIAYIEVSGDIDLSSTILLANGISTAVNVDLLSHKNINTFQLMVPKVLGQTQTLVCPGLAVLDALLPTCIGALKLSATTPSVGGFALVKLDAPDYWYIEARTTGLLALGASQIQAQIQAPIATPALDACKLFSGSSLSAAIDASRKVSDYSFSAEMKLSVDTDGGLVFRDQDDNNLWQLLFSQGKVSFKGKLLGNPLEALNANIVAFTPALNADYMVKVQVHGSKLRAKWWLKGAAEPVAWLLYADDTRLPGGGIDVIGQSVNSYQNFLLSTCLENETVSIQDTNTQNLLNNNHAPEISDVYASQQHDDGFVDIAYKLSDAESDYLHLTGLQYSLTGQFNGEQKTMTIASTDTHSEGTDALLSSPDGTYHKLVWNAKADVDGYGGNVYVRLKPKDSLEAGAFAKSEAFIVDVKNPRVVITSVKQSAGSDSVDVVYDISEEPGTNYTTVFQFSIDDGITWQDIPRMGQGYYGISMEDLGKLILPHTIKGIHELWSIGPQASDKDLQAIIRIAVTDKFQNNTAVSKPFNLDTKAPFGLANFKGKESNTNEIFWTWSPVAAEENFETYKISYGRDRKADAHIITKIEDATLGIMGTNSLLINNLEADTTYYATISAFDSFGNQTPVLNAQFSTKPIIPATEVSQPAAEETISSTLPVPPQGGFNVYFNDGAYTTNPMVELSLNAGSDVTTMAISNYADMHDAIQESFASIKQWDLCTPDNCETGKHKVYVRFYTKWGISSPVISSAINLALRPTQSTAPQSGSVQSEHTNVGGSISSGGGGGSSPSPTPASPTPNPQNGPNVSGLPTGSSAPVNPSSDVNNGGAPVPSLTTLPNQVSPAPPSTNQGTLTIVQPVSPPALTQLTKAKESPILLVPTVAEIHQAATVNTVEIKGKSIPNTEVILFIHSDQVVVYSTKADASGAWSFVHSQDQVNLAPGQHSLFAVTYDAGSNIKSKPSLIKTFEVKKNSLAQVRSYFDLWTTLLTVFVALLACFYLMRNRLALQS